MSQVRKVTQSWFQEKESKKNILLKVCYRIEAFMTGMMQVGHQVGHQGRGIITALHLFFG